MSHLLSIYNLNDTTAANYSYDPDKIEFTASGARLKLIGNLGQVFNQTFNSPVGFTYDSAKTEFVSGKCQQVDKLEANAICWATYTSITDLNWIASGVDIATITGSPVIANNRFECFGGNDDNAIYNNANIATIQDTGSVKVKWTSGYSGAPIANTNIFQLGDATNNNKFILFHSSVGGTFRVSAWDASGATIHSAAIIGASFLPVALTEYEISVNFTASTGVIEIYIDGVYHGATSILTFTRTGANYLYVGSGTTYALSDSAYEDLILYNTVQHSGGVGGNYTPGYTLEEARYLEDLITLPEFTYSDLGSIQQFTNYVISPDSLIRMSINDEYWTGSAWSVSDDSYAQMNDPATILANIGALTAADTVTIKMRTTDTSTQQGINSLELTYTGQIYPSDNPSIEIIAGIYSDKIYAWLEASVSKPVGTELKYILPSSPAKYWDGADWVASNDTYAQSNTVSELLINLDTLDILVGNLVKFSAFLNSDGTATPEITQLTLEYDLFPVIPLPFNTIVYGRVVSIEPERLEGAVIMINSYKPFLHGSNAVVYPVSATSDAEGNFELDCVETETVGIKTYVQIEYNTESGSSIAIYDDVIIPNTEIVSLETLLDGKSPRDIY